MENKNNIQNVGHQVAANHGGALVVRYVKRPVASRSRRGMKALAIVAGGMLSVITAVRVTTASETAPATQPTTEPSAAKIIDSDIAAAMTAIGVSNNSGNAAGIPASNTGVTDPATGDTTFQYASAAAPATPAAPQQTPAATPATATGTTSSIVADGTDKNGRISVSVNKSVVVTTKVPYKRISVGQPDVADVNPIGPGNLLLTGKKPGTTQLIIWDDADRSQVIDVEIVFDLQSLQDQLKDMFPTSSIQVKSLNGAVALRGRVPSVQAADQAVALATPYGQKVLNFLEVSGGQQVMLQVKFAEVSRSASSELGVNLGYSDGLGFGASNIGQNNVFAVTGGVKGESLTPGSQSGSITQFGHFGFGNTAIDVFVDALRKNNLLRVLAEPNLIAISGQNASFLAGGEIPIPVPQSGGGGGGSVVTIEYKEYGIRLNFVPIVLGDGKIRMKMAPEVSDLDYSHTVSSGGVEVPGITTRRMETTVEMNEGQTFAIAGLLQNKVTSTKSATPLLSDLPVLGALFRSVRYERDQTELVVLVTPKLVEAMNPDQTPAVPGEHWRDPNEADLFLNGDLGGEAKSKADPKAPPAKFHGHYGYMPSAPTTTQASADTSDAAANTTEAVEQ